jgi:hypothetical protein
MTYQREGNFFAALITSWVLCKRESSVCSQQLGIFSAHSPAAIDGTERKRANGRCQKILLLLMKIISQQFVSYCFYIFQAVKKLGVKKKQRRCSAFIYFAPLVINLNLYQLISHTPLLPPLSAKSFERAPRNDLKNAAKGLLFTFNLL